MVDDEKYGRKIEPCLLFRERPAEVRQLKTHVAAGHEIRNDVAAP